MKGLEPQMNTDKHREEVSVLNRRCRVFLIDGLYRGSVVVRTHVVICVNLCPSVLTMIEVCAPCANFDFKQPELFGCGRQTGRAGVPVYDATGRESFVAAC